ncbi:hypothetical protein GWK47_042395 [Chionoecetes opilio]|uniref:Uncharacterized protein n=1 Tax=Chionoecetes opilio TaxID=41210 RepID=A0A8J4YAC5_CHIOP|nr:hypothetical protein GWK47_042395 [Chionoecetes opilio]
MRQCVLRERPTVLGLPKKLKKIFNLVKCSLCTGMEKLCLMNKERVLTESPFLSPESILKSCLVSRNFCQGLDRPLLQQSVQRWKSGTYQRMFQHSVLTQQLQTLGTCRGHVSFWSRNSAAVFCISRVVTTSLSLLPRKRMWNAWGLPLDQILLSSLASSRSGRTSVKMTTALSQTSLQVCTRNEMTSSVAGNIIWSSISHVMITVELLELAIRCLDGALPKFSLRWPGALHRARWMAKLIYAMKILLFVNQFQLTARETLGLKRFTFFVIEVYVSAWFTASVPSSAPANDLRLLQDLSEYHDVKISRTCLTVFGRHLWYLSEGLVGLALFDPQVNATMKRNIVRAIFEREATEDSPKRAALPATSSLPTKQLLDFASRGSNFLFESLKMKTSFLSKEPDTWSDDEDFKTGVAAVGGLRVINDTAERGIALIQAFNSKITKSEDQRQLLLQVVEEQRRSQPGTSKQDLTSKKRKQ